MECDTSSRNWVVRVRSFYVSKSFSIPEYDTRRQVPLLKRQSCVIRSSYDWGIVNRMTGEIREREERREKRFRLDYHLSAFSILHIFCVFSIPVSSFLFDDWVFVSLSDVSSLVLDPILFDLPSRRRLFDCHYVVSKIFSRWEKRTRSWTRTRRS